MALPMGRVESAITEKLLFLQRPAMFVLGRALPDGDFFSSLFSHGASTESVRAGTTYSSAVRPVDSPYGDQWLGRYRPRCSNAFQTNYSGNAGRGNARASQDLHPGLLSVVPAGLGSYQTLARLAKLWR